MRTNGMDRKSLTNETIKRIVKASYLYLSDYSLSIKQIADELGVDERTLRENLFVHSKLIDEEFSSELGIDTKFLNNVPASGHESKNLYEAINNREYNKCLYIAYVFLKEGNIRKTSKKTGIPKSTVHDHLTKKLKSYPELSELYYDIQNILISNSEKYGNGFNR